MSHRFPRDFWTHHSNSADISPPALYGPLPGESNSRITSVDESGQQVPWYTDTLPIFDPGDKQLALFIPEAYEPNYAYPLLLWFHDAGGDEHELLSVMPQISTRNYFGLAFGGRVPAVSGRKVNPWPQSADDLTSFERELHSTICRLRQTYHVHSERVFLAGVGAGADFAMRLMLSQPAWYGGAVLLGANQQPVRHSLTNLDDLRHKRVMLATGNRDADRSLDELRETAQVLHTAGLDAAAMTYHGGHEPTGDILRHIDSWVMESLYATV